MEADHGSEPKGTVLLAQQNRTKGDVPFGAANYKSRGTYLLAWQVAGAMEMYILAWQMAGAMEMYFLVWQIAENESLGMYLLAQ